VEKYVDFAYIYDKLTYDVRYDETASFIEEIFEKFSDEKPSLVCDLACGTGTMCLKLNEKGYDMIGIDFSENMLDVALNKSEGKNILYLNQDICDFELYGTVDAFLCLLDSINHITDEKQLKKMFSLVHNYLNPEGLFIFDINTKYKFENVLSDNIFTYDSDEIYYVWENEYRKDEKLCDFYLTFFVGENDVYKRIDEYHVERCYEEDELEKMIKNSGFQVVAKYGEGTFEKPQKTSERIFYILKKIDWLFCFIMVKYHLSVYTYSQFF